MTGVGIGIIGGTIDEEEHMVGGSSIGGFVIADREGDFLRGLNGDEGSAPGRIGIDFAMAFGISGNVDGVGISDDGGALDIGAETHGGFAFVFDV